MVEEALLYILLWTKLPAEFLIEFGKMTLEKSSTNLLITKKGDLFKIGCEKGCFAWIKDF